MSGYKGLEGGEPLARRNLNCAIAFHREPRTRPRHGEGERKKLRHRLDMPDGKPVIAAPDIHNWGASAVIGGIHAHEIALVESGTRLLHPIAPILV